MWALNTCVEPNEFEFTILVLTDDFTALFQACVSCSPMLTRPSSHGRGCVKSCTRATLHEWG